MASADSPDVARKRSPAGEGDEAPDSPTRLPRRSVWNALKRTLTEFRKDNLTDWAAVLTYYGIQSIFPALLALVSVLGLFGDAAVQSLIDNVNELAPGAVRDLLVDGLKQLQNGTGKAGVSLVIGIVLALWSASGYISAFMRASNAVFDIGEGRPIWKTLPLRFAVTVVVVVLLAVSSVLVVFTGRLASRTGQVLGLGDAAVTTWSIAKWPVLVLIVMLLFALLYWASPNVKQPGFRWITPGSILAVVLWILASGAFGVYVANFGSYNKTYGSLATVIIFLIWLWLTNLAILLGLELNAELDRARAIAAGHPADEEPYVEPRDTRKLDDEENKGLGED